jgi:hypothetical protein
MIDPVSYYSTHSPMTYLPDEPELSSLLKGLPSTITEIVNVVQNTLIHIFWAKRMGLELTPEREGEVNIRSAADMLRKVYEINETPLTEKRELEEKLVGNCRDFTVLSVAFLRRNGIPSRARCGFGAYFNSPDDKLKYIDHWVVEYWNGDRWVMVDSQIDALQKKVLELSFDPLDVPHDMFITGGAAWSMCRSGTDPDLFGIWDMSGLHFVRGDLVRDLASLAKTPLLPWDSWGVMLDQEEIHYELMDRVAAATIPATEEYEEIMELNEHPLLKVPETVISWMEGTEPFTVKLSDVVEEM